jgi:TolB-like protein/Tfp pilus assembly protein PilF
MNSFFRELKQRKVYRVALGYAVVAWLVVQVSATVMPAYHAPEWILPIFITAVALGFPVALVLAWAFEIKGGVIEKTTESSAVLSAANKRQVWLLAAVGLVISALAVGAYWYPWGKTSIASEASPAAMSAIREKSIAVLPFENLSEDKANAYFADGIQEEILTRLAKIAGLKVISRTSTQRYQSKPANLSEIAKQLGVANILEGSVQKAGDTVRVSVNLIQAASDSHLWADTYDRKLTDIFAVESEIATKIADVLQAKLTGAEQRAIATRPTENSKAYELYLRGRYFLGKRSEAELNNAVDYFNRAIAEDRNYAPAYAGLAATYAVLVEWAPVDPAESLRKAHEAAIKALEIDNSLAEAHAALALVLLNADLDVHGARRELERAIELNPNYAAAHHWLAYVLIPLGEKDRAIAEYKRAVELDPFSPIINANFGRGLIQARRYPEAITQLRKAIELEPNFFFSHHVLGAALVLNGQIDEGIAEYERAEQLHPNAGRLGFLVNAYARKGDRQKALQILERIKQSSNTPIGGYAVAIGYAGLGDKNEAMNWLERGYAERESDVILIKVNPLLEPLHGDPRFEALAQKVLPNQ